MRVCAGKFTFRQFCDSDPLNLFKFQDGIYECNSNILLETDELLTCVSLPVWRYVWWVQHISNGHTNAPLNFDNNYNGG